VGIGLFLTAPAPNPAKAFVMRFPAIGFGAAETAAAGFGAVETKSDEVTVAEAATDATTPGLSVNYFNKILVKFLVVVLQFMFYVLMNYCYIFFKHLLRNLTHEHTLCF